MKKIKNYYQFILESILYANDDLSKILDEMRSPVAIKFKELIGKDIRTKYNLLKPSESDSVLFTSDSNLRYIKPEEYNGEFNNISIGRLVKNILKDNDIEDFNEKDIEDFVNEFKYLNERSETTDKIKIVEGEDIRKYYHESKYEFNDSSNTLAKSCMKYDRCQPYLQIYVDNPAQIKMVLLFGNDDKIKARALLWKTDIGYYLDRIYHTNNHEDMLIKNWAIKNISKTISFYPPIEEMYVKLSNKKDYDQYPFMDTFNYYVESNGSLLSSNYNIANSPFDVDSILILDDTFGGSKCAVADNKYYIDDEDIYSYYNQ